jgi:ABC-type branched-subunit amino acid transport system substrate-binding protein
MRRSRVQRVGALLIGLTLVAAACGDDDTEGTDTTGGAAPDTTGGAAPDTTGAEGPDTTGGAVTTTPPTDEPGEPGALEGLTGTTPLTELDPDFTSRMDESWEAAGNEPLVDYNYGAESYDAVVNIALAAAIAETDGAAMADQIVDITREGETCTDFAACMAIIEAGGDPDYDGISGPIDMNGNGDPTVGSYGMLQFGADNQIDDSVTEFIVADLPAEAMVDLQTTTSTREGDGVLTIGTILPETGSLAFLGPPEFAGVQLAVEDINAAGGVLGADVVLIQGDSGDTSTDIASQTVDRLLGEDVDAIVGAASSSVSLTVIDKITTAGVVQYSPANTSDQFSTYDDDALYFRNAPPDVLQGAVIGNRIVEDGHATAYILALDDAYGTGLADVAEGVLADAGVEVLDKVIYDPRAASFDSEVGAIADADPDAILLIAFDEASRITRTMVERGIGPTDKAVYGVDGFMGNAFGDNFSAGT